MLDQHGRCSSDRLMVRHLPAGRRRSTFIVAWCAALCTACASSGGPAAPSDNGTGGGGSNGRTVQGQAVSALDGSAAPGVSIQVGTKTVTSDASGNFDADIAAPGTYTVTASGASIVERQTSIAAPTSRRERLSLIPASFDLSAFDQMFRTVNARLQRWTARPALVVVASTQTYVGGSDEFSATSERMSDEDVSQLVAHMTEGLALLTGGTYTTFASVSVERPSSGQRTSVARAGAIVVGRYQGIESSSWDGVIGYGRWADQADGTVVAGAMFLDRDFDRDDSRRRLVRIHELGHTLGYLHVTTRYSIMNPSLGPDPTDFDRQAAIIAFSRPPGNKSPDVDPGQRIGWNSVEAPRWSQTIP
jgi:hypothetical protein